MQELITLLGLKPLWDAGAKQFAIMVDEALRVLLWDSSLHVQAPATHEHTRPMDPEATPAYAFSFPASTRPGQHGQGATALQEGGRGGTGLHTTGYDASGAFGSGFGGLGLGFLGGARAMTGEGSIGGGVRSEVMDTDMGMPRLSPTAAPFTPYLPPPHPDPAPLPSSLARPMPMPTAQAGDRLGGQARLSLYEVQLRLAELLIRAAEQGDPILSAPTVCAPHALPRHTWPHDLASLESVFTAAGLHPFHTSKTGWAVHTAPALAAIQQELLRVTNTIEQPAAQDEARLYSFFASYAPQEQPMPALVPAPAPASTSTSTERRPAKGKEGGEKRLSLADCRARLSKALHDARVLGQAKVVQATLMQPNVLPKAAWPEGCTTLAALLTDLGLPVSGSPGHAVLHIHACSDWLLTQPSPSLAGGRAMPAPGVGTKGSLPQLQPSAAPAPAASTAEPSAMDTARARLVEVLQRVSKKGKAILLTSQLGEPSALPRRMWPQGYATAESLLTAMGLRPYQDADARSLAIRVQESLHILSPAPGAAPRPQAAVKQEKGVAPEQPAHVSSPPTAAGANGKLSVDECRAKFISLLEGCIARGKSVLLAPQMCDAKGVPRPVWPPGCATLEHVLAAIGLEPAYDAHGHIALEVEPALARLSSAAVAGSTKTGSRGERVTSPATIRLIDASGEGVPTIVMGGLVLKLRPQAQTIVVGADGKLSLETFRQQVLQLLADPETTPLTSTVLCKQIPAVFWPQGYKQLKPLVQACGLTWSKPGAAGGQGFIEAPPS